MDKDCLSPHFASSVIQICSVRQRATVVGDLISGVMDS